MALKPEQPQQREAFDYAAAAARVYDPDAPTADVSADDPGPGPDPTDEPAPPAFVPPEAPPAPPSLTNDDPGPAPTPPEPPAAATAADKALRFASHEEAERGYAHLFSERQRLAEELKKVRDGQAANEQAAYEQQLADARREQMTTYVRERAKQHQSALSDLDPNDAGYDDAVAELEANYQLDLDTFRAAPPELPEDRMPPAPQKADPPDETPTDPLNDPGKYVSEELARHGLDMEDPFVRHMAGTLPGVGTRLSDGRQVTLGVQMELLVDQLATETLSRYCQQSASADLPGLEISHPVLQHFVRQQPVAGEDGKTVPFYARMQQAVRDTRRWQADERRKLLAQHDAPLPQSFGPGPAARTGAPDRPTSLGGVLDRVRDQSRIQ